jgi:tetratricopeptide (TPR) repeat protein
MLKLIKRIWRWLKNLFQGGNLSPNSRNRHRGKKAGQSPPALTDTDYEFLLSQLLDGIAHGWHEGRILKFFERLGDRGKARLWVDWLERFGAGVLASDAPNLELAARLIRLGELSQSFSRIQPIGEAAYHLGRQLYAKQSVDAVWEYDGADGELTVERATESFDLLAAGAEPSSPEAGVTLLTPEELLAQLQQDPAMAAQLSEQLGLAGSDPQALVEKLVQQFQSAHDELAGQPEPETVEGWFNRGLQQANLGDLAGAIASWDGALALNPDLAQAWHNRASALGNLGENEAAIASFDRALALNPDDPQAWQGKGNACYNLQQWEAAIACWDRALELQPDFAQGWFNRGSALEKLNRFDEAKSSYEKVLAIAPDFDLAKAKIEELSSGNSRNLI